MVNRQSRSPGELRQYQGLATISGDVPNIAIDQGAAFRALEETGGQLAGRLMQLANQAKEREDGIAGLAYGQTSAAAYLQARAVEQKAAERATGAEGAARRQVNAPAAVRDAISKAAKKHGVDATTLMRIAEIESSLNPNAKNPNSSAGGLFQFIDGTAEQYGLSNRYDPFQAADAGARLLKDNAAYLRSKLGREPTSGELYLAHQQGAGGAAKLLANPNAAASSIVGGEAVRLNGGNAGMSAGDFAALWTRKAGDKPMASVGAAGSDGVVTRHGLPEIPTGPLQLRNNGTIGGEAFDKAAIQAYSWRMAQGLTTDLANAHEDFKDDPAAFAKRMGEVQQTYLQDEALADPRVRETFDKVFAEHSTAYVKDVTDRHGKRLAGEQKVAMAEGLTAQTNAMEKQAYILGANPEGVPLLNTQLQRSFAAIDAAVANGNMEPADAAKARRGMESAVLRGQVQGTFDALETPEAKEQFALSIMEDWADGKGPLAEQPLEEVKALSETLRRDARSEANGRDASNVLEKSRIEQLVQDDVASIGASGKGVNFSSGGLDAGMVAKVLGTDKALDWAQKRQLAGMQWEATAGMETQTETDIAKRLVILEPKPGEPGYEGKAKVFEAAQKQASHILKERASDPAGAAEKAFPQIAEIAAQADPAKPDTMQALVQARMEGQSALGVPEFSRDPLTQKEASNLARALTGDLDAQNQGRAVTALAEQVDAAYGPHANAVMAQVLNQTGVDRDLAKAGASVLARIRRGDKPAKADMRAGGVASEAAAADKAGVARQTDAFPIANYKQQQMLLENPDMATQFDQKFGTGAAAKILGMKRADPAVQKTADGTVTIAPDGSESFKPNGQ